MIRLHVVVEGRSEERFVRRSLAPHLAHLGVFVDCRAVETSRDRRAHRVYRGGLLDYGRAKRDLQRWMKQESAHRDSWFTTMFDLYALPVGDPPEGFPGTTSPRDPDPYRRVDTLEEAFARDIDHRRFIPYLQLHEFEALVLVDPSLLGSTFLGCAAAVKELVQLTAGVDTPEKIDDGPQTAPSKRIIACIPEYEDRKAEAGPAVVEGIGLSRLRASCPHFDQWVARLEGLAR